MQIANIYDIIRMGLNMKEYLDIFDENETMLGTKTREECHNQNVNFYHKVAWAWLINDNNEILIQQRSWNKSNRPGCWEELSVAGHVLSGESPEQACIREISEELGIKTNNLEFLNKWLLKDTNEIVYFYATRISQTITDLTLQKEEVADAKFVNFEDFKYILINGGFGKYPLEYINLVKNLLSKVIK